MKIKVRTLTYIVVTGISIIIITLVFCNCIVSNNSNGRLYFDVDSIQPTEVGLLLGTTPQTRVGGRMNMFFKYRIDAAEELYNADELTWQTVKLKHRIGLMNLLDWNQMLRGADGYIPTIIENETLDTDEWIELVETVKDLNVEDEVLNDSFYDKLDDDLKSEISGFSDQGECDEEFKKVESLKKLLPDWKWYDVYGEIDDAEKRIKEEEDEADYDDDYEQWRSQSEKEDAQIDEMFGALRWN